MVFGILGGKYGTGHMIVCKRVRGEPTEEEAEQEALIDACLKARAKGKDEGSVATLKSKGKWVR